MRITLPRASSRRRASIDREPSASARPPEPGRICSWRWALAGFVVVAGMVLFYRLGSFRTFSSHEVYAVVPAREMLETGDWILPKFGGLERLRKPPLAYWIVAGSARMLGGLSPLSARLPSAFAGLLLAGLMGVWAWRWYGPRVGWAAAFVQLTSAWFVIFARKAEIDMALCLFTTTALFLIADEPLGESSRRSFFRWLAVYGLLSLAWLAKFHYGPTMVLAPAAVFVLIERRWDQLKKFVHPLGWVCFLAAALAWPMLVLRHVPDAWEIWRRETVGRAFGEMGSHPLLYYLPFFLWMPMPWTLFAFASVRRSWRAAWKEKDPKERFLWVWCLTQLVIVMLSVSKHKHYLLAMMPMLTLLAARSLSESLHKFREGRWRLPWNWIGLLIGMNLALGAVLVAAMAKQWPALTGPAVILAVLLTFAEGAGWILLNSRRVFPAMALNVLTIVVGGVVVAGWILPHCDRRMRVQEFAAEIREEVVPNRPVCVYRMELDPIVYHLGSPVFRRETPASIRQTLEEEGRLYVLGYAHFVRELQTLGEARSLARLPKGQHDQEPLEGDLVLVKLTPHRLAAKTAPGTPNAN